MRTHRIAVGVATTDPVPHRRSLPNRGSGQDMTKRKAPGHGREPIALGEPIDPDLLQRDADHELLAARKIDINATNKASLLEMLTYCRGRA